nr:SUMF1/EgtB/PvdO family nonheme iron enzyme [Streptomyces sp. BSE6.1]
MTTPGSSRGARSTAPVWPIWWTSASAPRRRSARSRTEPAHFGVLDMAGNADEWTSTLYAPYPGAPEEVPRTEDWAFDRHITRGGAFRHDRDLARCARRHGAYEADLAAIGVGFRLAAPAA